MPGLDGFELLRRVRTDAAIQSLIVILLSARGDEDTRIEGLEAGADDYLVKPFSARELLARTAAHLATTRMRQRTAAALRESEERFRKAFEGAAIGFAIVEPDGRFRAANRALCDMLGYSESELVAMTFQNLTYPDDLEPDLALANRLLAGEIESYRLEKRTPAQIGEPKLGVRTAGKREIRGWGSSRERARGGPRAIGIILWTASHKLS